MITTLAREYRYQQIVAAAGAPLVKLADADETYQRDLKQVRQIMRGLGITHFIIFNPYAEGERRDRLPADYALRALRTLLCPRCQCPRREHARPPAAI